MDIEIRSSQLDVSGLLPLLQALDTACRELDLDFYLIGALARDIHFQGVSGVEVPRATRDVDVAIGVADWEAYQRLQEDLIANRGFSDEQQKQRVRSPEGTLLDLVPFGGIVDGSGKVQFPSEEGLEMTVLGFEEVLQDAITAQVDEQLSVQVASLPGLSLLKLISWADQPRQRAKDAQDLCFVMRHYFDLNVESIYAGHSDLFDEEDFSRPRASARILGRDLANLLQSSEQLQDHVLSILGRETADFHQSRLADAMKASGCYVEHETRFECLASLLRGLEETLHSS